MINVVCFGDSITEGAEFPFQDRWTTLLQNRLEQVHPQTFKVHNKGIGGNTTSQGLDRFYEDVFPYLPALVLIEFGFNDANVKDFSVINRVSLEEFERNIREFLRIIEEKRGLPILIFNHEIGLVAGKQGNGMSYNENYAVYDVKTRSIANDLNCLFIDIAGEMKHRTVSVESFVSEDQIHLSKQANHKYAEYVHNALMKNEEKLLELKRS